MKNRHFDEPYSITNVEHEMSDKLLPTVVDFLNLKMNSTKRYFSTNDVLADDYLDVYVGNINKLPFKPIACNDVQLVSNKIVNEVSNVVARSVFDATEVQMLNAHKFMTQDLYTTSVLESEYFSDIPKISMQLLTVQIASSQLASCMVCAIQKFLTITEDIDQAYKTLRDDT